MRLPLLIPLIVPLAALLLCMALVSCGPREEGTSATDVEDLAMVAKEKGFRERIEGVEAEIATILADDIGSKAELEEQLADSDQKVRELESSVTDLKQQIANVTTELEVCRAELKK